MTKTYHSVLHTTTKWFSMLAIVLAVCIPVQMALAASQNIKIPRNGQMQVNADVTMVIGSKSLNLKKGDKFSVSRTDEKILLTNKDGQSIEIPIGADILVLAGGQVSFVSLSDSSSLTLEGGNNLISTGKDQKDGVIFVILSVNSDRNRLLNTLIGAVQKNDKNGGENALATLFSSLSAQAQQSLFATLAAVLPGFSAMGMLQSGRAGSGQTAGGGGLDAPIGAFGGGPNIGGSGGGGSSVIPVIVTPVSPSKNK